MIKFRSTLLIVLIFLALLISAVVQAQDGMGFDTCSGLTEADCTVISEAIENGLGDATSFTVDINLDLSASELHGFLAIGTWDPNSNLANLNDVTFTIDGTFDVVMDEENETGSLAGSFTSSYSMNGSDVTEVALDVVALEGLAYINDGNGWKSIDLARLSESEVVSDITVNLESLMKAMTLIINAGDFITNERVGDDFVSTIDFTDFRELPVEYPDEFIAILAEPIEVQDHMIASVYIIASLLQLFDKGDLSLTQTVDTENNIISAIDLDAQISLNMLTLPGEATNSGISLAASLAFSNLDAVSIAETPANAVNGTDEFIAMIEEIMLSLKESDG